MHDQHFAQEKKTKTNKFKSFGQMYDQHFTQKINKYVNKQLTTKTNKKKKRIKNKLNLKAIIHFYF